MKNEKEEQKVGNMNWKEEYERVYEENEKLDDALITITAKVMSTDNIHFMLRVKETFENTGLTDRVEYREIQKEIKEAIERQEKVLEIARSEVR